MNWPENKCMVFNFIISTYSFQYFLTSRLTVEILFFKMDKKPSDNPRNNIAIGILDLTTQK